MNHALLYKWEQFNQNNDIADRSIIRWFDTAIMAIVKGINV